MEDRLGAHTYLYAMAQQRVKLSLDDEINGPFSTVDACAAIGYEDVLRLNKLGSLFWADHSKRYYYAFQEVQSTHKVSTPWYYFIPNPLDECSAQYGRVRIYSYSKCILVIDSFTREVYVAFDLQQAFEIAVYIVHYFADERVVPDIELGYTAVLPKMTPTQADLEPTFGSGNVTTYEDGGKARLAVERSIDVGLPDAISIIMGDRPSERFIAKLCALFPQALMSAYGAPLIAYNPDTTTLSVARSISSLAMVQDINPSECIQTYLDNYKVGKYTIVGGWGYRILEQYGKDFNTVSLIDIALAHSGSPEVTRASIGSLIDQSSGDQAA